VLPGRQGYETGGGKFGIGRRSGESMKRCPYCGGEGEARWLEKPKRAVRFVCVVCGSQSSVKFNVDEARESWDGRVDEWGIALGEAAAREIKVG